MELRDRPIALYGKFLSCPREAMARRVRDAGGWIARDLTRSTAMLVVGQGALNLIANGLLPERLDRAARRGVPVHDEATFCAMLDGAEPEAATLPVQRLNPSLPEGELRLLSAFGLIRMTEGHVRFADAQTVRQAAALRADGHDIVAVIRALRRADAAPTGRRRVITGPTGEAALEWDDGLTDLAGQGLLPLDPVETVDELFDTAMLAEAEGDLRAAERLYALCTRAERRDPIAPYNLANMLAARGAHDEAATHYRLAIARDPGFAEAEYNLAVVLEEAGDLDGAEAALERAVALDRRYADALFNLAQLKLKRGDLAAAGALYRRYLAADPPEDWAAKARKALTLIAAEGGK